MAIEYISFNSDASRQVDKAFKTIPRDGRFSITTASTILARHLDVQASSVYEILSTPRIQVYRDVLDAITLIVECGSLPVIWTQGNLDDDEQGVPFQRFKLEKSGIASMFGTYEDLYQGTGIQACVGGPQKTQEEVLDPLYMQALHAGFRRIVVVDDLADNLDAAMTRADHLGIELDTFQICRNGIRSKTNTHTQIEHLLQMNFRPDTTLQT